MEIKPFLLLVPLFCGIENVGSIELPTDGLKALQLLASVDIELGKNSKLNASFLEIHCLSWSNVTSDTAAQCFNGWSKEDPLCLGTTTDMTTTTVISTTTEVMTSTTTVSTKPSVIPSNPMELMKKLSEVDVTMINDPTLKSSSTLLELHCLSWKNLNNTAEGAQCFSGWYEGDELCPGTTTVMSTTLQVGKEAQ